MSNQIQDPRAYTPSHLAEKILRDRFRLEGERRRVTVLFVDAVGSTPITERIDEEEAYGLMQRFVAAMMESVHRYEGTVTQFRGDGIMALFGAPIAHEDSARRAVSAALHMRDSLVALAEQVEKETGLHYEFRIGINTGPVVVGRIAEDLTMQYSAIGDTINLGARMEQIAEPGTIYLTEETHRLVSDWCECEAVDPTEVKGKSELVNPYKAIREKGARTRLEIAAERGLTPFVGRLQELMVLQGFYGHASQGRGQVAFISGDAGMGKSRLLMEFRRALGDEVNWLEGHCISYARNIPYLPIVDLLKRSFSIDEIDLDPEIIEKIDVHTEDWDENNKATVPYLKFLLNVDPGDEQVASMDPRERRAGILDGLRGLILEQSSKHPLVLVIEDLHWVDDKSEEAVAALIDVVAAVPMLVLLTYRPGYVHSLGERTFFSRIALQPLPAEESKAIASAVCDVSGLPQELSDLVLQKAEGNPFYVEEVVKSLAESGVIEKRGDDIVLLRPLAEVKVPDNIHDVILSRIDRLEAEAKQAIQLASVIGREFTVRLLDRISDLEERLETALHELKILELIYEKTFLPELAYMFKHALTHDVAYSTLLKESRKALHVVVARAIEELYADRLAENHETLAHHYYEAQEWGKALEYLLLSAVKAYQTYAPEDALSFCKRTLEVAGKLGNEGFAAAAQAHQMEALIRLWMGNPMDARKSFESAIAIARELGDRRLEGVTIGMLGIVYLFLHDFDKIDEQAKRAFRIAEEEGFDDINLQASVLFLIDAATTNRLDEADHVHEKAKALAPKVTDNSFARGLWAWFGGFIPHWKGQYQQALAHFEEWGEARQQAGDAGTTIGGLWVEAMSLGGAGRYEEALDQLLHALERSERAGEVFYQARMLNTIGWLYMELQDFAAAFDWNSRSLDLANQIVSPDPEIHANARLNLGDALAATGRLDEAEEQYQWVEEIYRRIGPQYRPAAPPEIFMMWRYAQHLLHGYGELHLMRGDGDKALSYADECLELAESTDSARNVVKAKRLRGETLTLKRELGRAENELVAALDVAEQVGNPTQKWKTLAALGRLRNAQGRSEDALTSYSNAWDVIEEVAAGLKLERREIFLASPAVVEIKGAAGL